MAGLPPNPHTVIPNWGSLPAIDGDEYHIQGQMITAQQVITEYELANKMSFFSQIKSELAVLLAAEMLSKNMIEFTSQDNFQDGSKTVRARIFVTPGSQVQILRTKFSDKVKGL